MNRTVFGSVRLAFLLQNASVGLLTRSSLLSTRALGSALELRSKAATSAKNIIDEASTTARALCPPPARVRETRSMLYQATQNFNEGKKHCRNNRCLSPRTAARSRLGEMQQALAAQTEWTRAVLLPAPALPPTVHASVCCSTSPYWFQPIRRVAWHTCSGTSIPKAATVENSSRVECDKIRE